MDCIVHGVVKSWTRLSDFHTHTHTQSQVQEVSCFPHRTKVGCSQLAVVLMTHHFLSFCRKNDAWDAISRAASQLPAQVRGEDQDFGDSDKTAVTSSYPVP